MAWAGLAHQIYEKQRAIHICKLDRKRENLDHYLCHPGKAKQTRQGVEFVDCYAVVLDLSERSSAASMALVLQRILSRPFKTDILYDNEVVLPY